MIDLSQYELKEVYRKVLDHLSDDDKIRISIENYNIEKLKDIIVYYDLQENPLLNTLALTKYGKDAWRSYRYAKYVIQGRWLEVEDTIKTDPKQAYRYAKYVIQGRWLEAEEYIKTNPYWAYCYALDVIKGRCPEAEEYIKNDPKWAKNYALDVMNELNFWEKTMIDLSQYELKEKYRKILEHLSDDDKIRISIENYDTKELRDIVIYYDLQDNPLLKTLGFEKYGKDPQCAYWYAKDVIQGRWIEAEEIIKTDPEYAYWYTLDVIKGRFPEAEDIIKKYPYLANEYARFIMKDENFWDKN